MFMMRALKMNSKHRLRFHEAVARLCSTTNIHTIIIDVMKRVEESSGDTPITARGFIDIGRQQTFEPRLEGDVNKTSQLPTNSTFLKAFSVIFDASFESESTLEQFIGDETEDPFVEVVFWQENVITESEWLKQQRLTIRRNLRHPSKVTVNSKSIRIKDFYELCAKLGLVTSDGVSIHRLLKPELTQLSIFTGDNLWNLVNILCDSHELVQVIELKQKKRQILREQARKHIADMDDGLAEKLKQRDEIRHYHELSRRFYTLINIIHDTNRPLLEAEKESIGIALDQITTEMNGKSLEIFHKKSDRISSRITLETKRKMLSLINDECSFLRLKLSEISVRRPPGRGLFALLYKKFLVFHESAMATLTSLEASAVACEEFFREKLAFSKAEAEAVKWKISLKNAQRSGNFESRLQLMKSLIESEQKAAQRIENHLPVLDQQLQANLKRFKNIVPLDTNNLKTSLAELDEQQLEYYRQILKLRSEILTQRRISLEISEDISSMALLRDVNISYVETLKVIESVLSKQSHIFSAYLGPVFQYLNPTNDFDYKMWPKLSAIACTILFTEGSMARQADKVLRESGLKLGRYVFLGVDEFSMKAIHIPPELAENVKVANSLILPDLPLYGAMEAFKPVLALFLKRLLRNIILIDRTDIDEEEVMSLRSFIVNDKDATATSSRGCLTVHNIFSTLPEITNTSLISVLQNIYANVKNYAEAEKMISHSVSVQNDLEKLLETRKTNSEKILRRVHSQEFVSTVVAVLPYILHPLKLRMDLRHRQLYNTALSQVLSRFESFQEVKKLDEKELLQVQGVLETKLKEDQELYSNLELDLLHNGNRLEDIISRLKFLKKSLGTCLNTPDPLSDCITLDEINSLIESELEVYEKQQEEAQEKTLQKANSDYNDGLELELFEIQCDYHAKMGEKEKIESAMHQLVLDGLRLTDDSVYEEFRRAAPEALWAEIDSCQEQLRALKDSSQIELVTKEQYGHLIATIKKAKDYSKAPIQIIPRNKIAAKAFPLLNRLVVKILKDAICHCRETFNSVMGDYVKKAVLSFYTRDTFDEVHEDAFSWDHFDLRRLKSMDFAVTWKKDCKIDTNVLRKIKGLLLILHIINYLSVFKFIFIDDKIFEDMDESLSKKLEEFFKTISPFVQIIRVTHEEQAQLNNTEPEPMETSQ